MRDSFLDWEPESDLSLHLDVLQRGLVLRKLCQRHHHQATPNFKSFHGSVWIKGSSFTLGFYVCFMYACMLFLCLYVVGVLGLLYCAPTLGWVPSFPRILDWPINIWWRNTLVYFCPLSVTNSGLYYKTITIIKMMIISDAPNCGITYDCNWQH